MTVSRISVLSQLMHGVEMDAFTEDSDKGREVNKRVPWEEPWSTPAVTRQGWDLAEARELRVNSKEVLVMPKRELRKPGMTAQLKLWFCFAFLPDWVCFSSRNFTGLPAMQEIARCHKTSCQICTHQ